MGFYVIFYYFLSLLLIVLETVEGDVNNDHRLSHLQEWFRSCKRQVPELRKPPDCARRPHHTAVWISWYHHHVHLALSVP